MKKNLIKTSRILLFLAAGFFFLLIAFRDIAIENLIAGLKAARYEWVLLSLFFAILAFISRAVRWMILIEPLGYRPLLKNTFYSLMTGYLANFVLPRIGEITRCGSLNRTDGIPVGSLLGTVITERITDLLVLILLAVSVFFMKIDVFGNFLYSYLIKPFAGRISSLPGFPRDFLIVTMLIVLLLIFLYRILKPWLGKYKLYRRSALILRRVSEGMKSVLKLEKKIYFLSHTVFIWVMYCLMTWAVFMALPATSSLNAPDVLFIMVIGGLGMAAPVQGGMGTYHWIVSIGLGIYGISREEGLVFATLAHESQALLMIVIGSFSMFIVFLKKDKASVSVPREAIPENNT